MLFHLRAGLGEIEASPLDKLQTGWNVANEVSSTLLSVLFKQLRAGLLSHLDQDCAREEWGKGE